jgi:Concanavalin A-like lectin/glucanases superfamily
MSPKTWFALSCFVLPLAFSCVGDPPIPGTGPVKIDGGPSPIVDGAVTTDGALPTDGALVDAGTCYPLPSTALAWWKGEGNGDNALSFSTPRVNDLAWKSTGGPTYVKATVGQGFYLNSDALSYLEVSGSSNVNTSTSFSVEAWIKFDITVPPRNMVVLSRRPQQGAANGWSLGRDVKQNLYVDLGGQTASGNKVLNDGLPTHIAVTFNPSTSRVALYVNGVLDVDQPGVSAVPNSKDVITVGADPSILKGKISGIIDELTLYGRMLKAAEIAAIYQAGPAGKCPTQ